MKWLPLILLLFFCCVVAQDGRVYDWLNAATSAGDDGSVFLAGSTNGLWFGTKDPGVLADFVVIKLDADGKLLWGWQVNENV